MTKIWIFTGFITMAVLLSCKKIVSVGLPKDQLTTEAVFASEESAQAALRGVYSEIMRVNGYIGNGGLSLFCGLSADELTRTSSFPLEDAFAQNGLTPGNFYLQTNFWAKGYFHLFHVNSLLENLERSAAIGDALKKQLRGEALFLRAFFHFYLVNLFGPVPLSLTTDYRINQSLTRSDSASVYRQIVGDLEEAKALLGASYPSPERLRVNRWAAAALLARVYLYQGRWQEAEAEAGTIIASGTYSLATLSNVFLPTSPETILQWLPAQSQSFNTAEGFAFIPVSATARPNYILSPGFLNSFETGDGRKTAWLKTVTVSGTSYTHPFKYKVRTTTSGTPKSEYSIVLRLAEVYLVRAEARLRRGDVAGAKADLNLLRLRAGLTAVTTNDPGLLTAAIEKEKSIEFFAEWGHRWFDLKRTGRADAVLAPLKAPGWEATDVRYPIPQAELAANPLLTQNPGY